MQSDFEHTRKKPQKPLSRENDVLSYTVICNSFFEQKKR